MDHVETQFDGITYRNIIKQLSTWESTALLLCVLDGESFKVEPSAYVDCSGIMCCSIFRRYFAFLDTAKV